MNNNNFANSPIPGSCGAGNMPVYGTYNLSPSCNNGVASNTFATQTQALSIQLSKTTPYLTYASSTDVQYIQFGSPLSSACAAFVAAQVGVASELISNFYDASASRNMAATALACFLDDRASLFGLIVNMTGAGPGADVASLNGTMVIADPCLPSYSSDVQGLPTQNCSGSCAFTFSNIAGGTNYSFVLTLPAGVGATVNVCDCALEVPAFSSCPSGQANVAQIPVGAFCGGQ